MKSIDLDLTLGAIMFNSAAHEEYTMKNNFNVFGSKLRITHLCNAKESENKFKAYDEFA